MKVTIIGGGIGGLTLAIALAKKGIDFDLYEAAPNIKEVGAGILLGVNAMLVYKALGLEKFIYKAGKALKEASITDQDHRTISRMPLQDLESQYGVKSVIIHRAALIEVLRQFVNPDNIHLNKKAIQVIDLDQEPLVCFEDGTTASSELIIGADGIHSNIREAIFPGRKKRYLGQTCWRGVVEFDLPTDYQDRIVEAWGPEGRFAFTPLNNAQVYWFAVKKAPKGVLDNPATIQSKLIQSFGNYGGPSREIILATPVEKILRNDICDLKPQKGWHLGKIGLIGDAAHATSPNLGQGGAQAIEDAHTLAFYLAESEDLMEALSLFENYRFPKTQLITNQSKFFGQIAHWEQAFSRRLRNSLLRSIPKKIFLKQFEKIYAVHPQM